MSEERTAKDHPHEFQMLPPASPFMRLAKEIQVRDGVDFREACRLACLERPDLYEK